jgi:hypothetical protein
MSKDSGFPLSEEQQATTPPDTGEPPPVAAVQLTARKGRSRRRQVLSLACGSIMAYLLIAYLILPFGWRRYGRRHPPLDDIPRITRTGADIPGDPLNVALVGSETDLEKILLAANWHPADPLTFRSCLKISGASVLKRQYEEAPVSSLYLKGRKQDLAFQQAVGNSPRHRHHVRFWRTQKLDSDGRPVWVGSAVYDQRVGLSRTTGQVTHVTAADVDTERDFLFHDLEQTGDLAERYAVDDFHKKRQGRNGGGDPWRTDGKLYVGIIALRSPP